MRTLPAISGASTEVSVEAPGQQVVPATQKVKRTAREAQLEYWRDVKAGRRVRNEKPHEPPKGPDHNPLFGLSEEERAKLFAWLRDCPYMDAARVMLREKGLPEATNAQFIEFQQEEAQHHWEMRTGGAAIEAEALVRFVEQTKPKFSAAILAALGQETFGLIAKGSIEPGIMGRLATLFLKARSDDRADLMQGLKREKLQGELQGQVNLALEKLAEEVEQHPAAKEAFEALRRELNENAEEA